jgi:hypothetical protein
MRDAKDFTGLVAFMKKLTPAPYPVLKSLTIRDYRKYNVQICTDIQASHELG